ncbi:MAG: DUF4112 domain-containing protein [Desulfuromonadales bacterium]|nr:DUF4112 domain-containing protein [Desulfuromonadales bacterium]
MARSDRRDQDRQRLERLAWLLDSSIYIPGLGVRIGLDGLIGLFPGVGDTLGAVASSWIISEAARLGAPRSVLLKMAFNVAVDAIFGAIPVVGDLFDFAWKANLRNVRLLGEYLERPRKTVVVSRLFVWSLLLMVLLFVFLMAALMVLVVRWLWLAVTGQ